MSAAPKLQTSLPDWAIPCLSLEPGTPVDEYGILRLGKSSAESANFHHKLERGPSLRQLQQQDLHLANWEKPFYERAMASITDSERCGIVLDAGCGDGRFTEWLLDHTDANIIAFDQHLGCLQSLSEYVQSRPDSNRVVFIECDLLSAPLQPQSIDGGFAMGVLYYLNSEFEAGLKHLAGAIKPAGFWADSLPSFGAAALLALLFEGLDDFINVCQNQGWIERHGETKSVFRSFRQEEVAETHSAVGLELEQSIPLSLLPVLLRILQVRGHFSDEELVTRIESLRHSLRSVASESESAGLILRKWRKAS